eukprot:GHVQ01030287.1.p1 GENE.GHVQ01030287.1~~GHVQ01030287.1.p1  ORF type:complete len:538 (-),score=117.83 GHVQ01030287.1:866-2479(-)
MEGGDMCEWDDETTNSVLKACEEALTHTARKDLERRVRSGTGTEDKGRMHSCCPTAASCSSGKCASSHTHTPRTPTHSHDTHTDCAEKHTHDTTCSGSSTTTTASVCKANDREEVADGKGVVGDDCSTSVGCAREEGRCSEGGVDETTEESIEGGTGDSCDSQINRGMKQPPPYVFKKDPEDHLGESLDSWASPSGLLSILPQICDSAARVYNRVMQKGRKDGLHMPGKAEEKQLRREILKESLIRTIQTKVQDQMRVCRSAESLEGGLLANPSGYTEGPLNTLHEETMRDLMHNGFAVQKDLIGPLLRSSVYEDCELLEFDGIFNEVFQAHQAYRTDSMCWLTCSDLNRQKHQGLMHLFRRMMALPYELNMKANLCLQASWVFQLACFSDNGSFYHKHMDGGYSESRNNGKKITCVYFPNDKDWTEADGGYLRMYPRQTRLSQQQEAEEQQKKKKKEKESCTEPADPEGSTSTQTDSGENSDAQKEGVGQDIRPASDVLVMYRSRDMPHEVLNTYRKRFSITLWITGPAGPGDACD